MKRRIKLSESDLRHIIKRSVNRILKENMEDDSINKLSELLTGLDENTAMSVSKEIQRAIISGTDFDTFVNALYSFLDPTPYEYNETDDIDSYARDRIDIDANMDDFPPMR